MEALNHNGVKADMHSVEVLALQTGEKRSQIFRLIRLTELVVDLLDKVDARKLAFTPAVELSYLSLPEQTAVAECMAKYQVKPSLSQAVRLKKLKKDGALTGEVIDNILAEEKKQPQGEPTGTLRYRKFFPADYSKKQIETVIVGLLKEWKARSAL